MQTDTPQSPKQLPTAKNSANHMALAVNGTLDLQTRLRSLFKLCNEKLQPRVSALFADVGQEKPISFLYHNPNVSDIEAIQMRQDLFDALIEDLSSTGQSKASVYRKDGIKQIVLGVPLKVAMGSTVEAANELDTIGAIAISVEDAPKDKLQLQLQLLESLAGLMIAASGPATSAEDNEAGKGEGDATAQLVQALSKSSPKEISYQLANSLANSLECEQVVIGLVVGNQIKPMSFSGACDIKTNSRGATLALQAMAECADNEEAVAFPAIEGGEQVAACLLHEQWSAGTAQSNILSIPLTVAEQTAAVVSLRRKHGKHFKRDEVDAITQQLSPFGPAFLTLNKADRTLARHVVDSITERFSPTQSRAFKIIALAITTSLTVWLTSGKMTYQPRCSADLQPVNVRQISCPYEAVLSKVLVSEGQVVRAGDPLIEFDSTKLQLERDMLVSQQQEAEARLSETLTNQDPSNMAIERAKRNVIRTKILALDERLAFSRLRAPVDGLVTRCDLSTKIGQPFRFGDPLIEIVDTGAWKVKIAIPDTVVSDIEPGQTGVFTPYGRPHESFEYEIVSLRGSAEQVDGANVFIAEAYLSEERPWMRAGMEGFAKTDVGERSVYWVWFHDTYDWICLQLWY